MEHLRIGDLAIEPLPGGRAFGAIVTGLKEAEIDAPQVRQALYDLWIDKGLLVFRGLKGRANQFRLSQIFGELEIHPLPFARAPDQPEITPIHYRPGEHPVHLVEGEERGAFLPWHSDLIYNDRINRGGILRAIRLPSWGGQTGFLDQIHLFDALPENLKEKIRSLRVIYRYGYQEKRFGRQAPVLRGSFAKSRDSDTYVSHPMVFAQAETGREVLNVSPWFAVAVEGMETEEGDALLARIISHCEDDSRAYFHAWQDDDMVLWDNWRMLHCAFGVRPEEPRVMERTTLMGDYQLGRIVRGEAASQVGMGV